MEICLTILKLKLLDDKRIGEVMAEHGVEPTEYNREVVKKQLSSVMGLKVERTQKKEKEPNGKKD
jgi:hypothetical protein